MKMILGRNETRGVPIVIIIIALILSVCFAIVVIHEESQLGGHITWHSLDEINNAENLIFIDVSAEWCGPCNKMDEYTFKHKKVASVIQSHFFPIKVDGADSSGIEFCKEYQINVYPTMLIIDPEINEEIKRMEGFRTPDVLLKELGEVIKIQSN